jgi:hypothetical protein
VLVYDFLLCGICFMIKSNMGLCIAVYVLFIRSFCVLLLCRWKRSHVFYRGLLLQCEICPLFPLSCIICVVYIVYVVQI